MISISLWCLYLRSTGLDFLCGSVSGSLSLLYCGSGSMVASLLVGLAFDASSSSTPSIPSLILIW